jgi:hypothetical protein
MVEGNLVSGIPQAVMTREVHAAGTLMLLQERDVGLFFVKTRWF